jgi:hypothetical protein
VNEGCSQFQPVKKIQGSCGCLLQHILSFNGLQVSSGSSCWVASCCCHCCHSMEPINLLSKISTKTPYPAYPAYHKSNQGMPDTILLLEMGSNGPLQLVLAPKVAPSIGTIVFVRSIEWSIKWSRAPEVRTTYVHMYVLQMMYVGSFLYVRSYEYQSLRKLKSLYWVGNFLLVRSFKYQGLRKLKSFIESMQYL